MIRKSLSLLAVTFVFAAISCKQESAADKITDADIKAIQEQNAIAGKLAKIELDKEIHDFGTIAEGTIVETEFIVKNVVS